MLILALVACRPVPTDADSDGGSPPDTHADDAPGRQWQRLHDAPCALDADGLLGCWFPPSWADWEFAGYRSGVEPSQVALTDINTANVLWGVSAANGLPVQPVDWSYQIEFPNLTGFTDLTHNCARRSSEIVCFDQAVNDEVFPPDRAYRRLGGEFLSWVALDTTNRLTIRVYRYPAEDLAYEVALPTGLEVVDLAVVQESACVLSTTGEVSCHGGPLDGLSPLPEPGPYRRFFGRRMNACGVRAADDLIVCNDGTTYDWGPLRDVVVGPTYKQVVVGGQPGTVGGEWGDPPSLCAITERNRIRCAGGHYDVPDLQAMLPMGYEDP